jgi:transitional endoplasmic reticulum ATPase
MSSLSSLRDALKLSPDNIPLLQLFAQACLDEFAFDEARDAFEKILQQDSGHAEARLGVIRTLYLSGSISEAIVRLESFLKSNTNHASA